MQHDSLESSQRKQQANQRDRRIIGWMQNDFEKGFTKLVEVYWKQLYRIAYNVLEGTGLAYMAEDVAQESLIKAYNSLRSTWTKDPRRFAKTKLRAWLYTIVRNESISLLRAGDQAIERSDGQRYIEESSWDTQPSYMLTIAIIGPEDLLERAETIEETRHLTRQALDKLSVMERQVIERKYLSERNTGSKEVTFEQIAKEMNIPVGTAKSAASRGRAGMRKILIEQWEKPVL